MATESAAQGESLVFHPLDQFKITRLFGEGPIEWYTPTNTTLWMALAVITIFAIFVLGSKGRALIPTPDAVGRRVGLWVRLQDG